MDNKDPLHDEIMTVEEVAELLRIHPQSVYEKVEKHELPGAFRLGGNDKAPIRFSKRTIMELIQKEASRP